LFFAERAKNNKNYPAGKTLLFLCRPLNGKGKDIILCVLSVSAVKSVCDVFLCSYWLEQIYRGGIGIGNRGGLNN